MFKKSPVGLKEVLVKVTLTLLVLSILASAVAIVPVVKAQGYPHIPTMPPSTPTPIPSPTPKPSPAVSPSPTEIPWNFPSYNPTQSPTVKGGFWSPLTIGIVVVALVAFAVPAVFFYTRRGKQKMLIDEERPLNTPEFPAASNRSAVSSRYSQSSYQSSYQSQQSSKPHRNYAIWSTVKLQLSSATVKSFCDHAFYPDLKLQSTAPLYEDLPSLQTSSKKRPKCLSTLRQKAKVKA